MGITKILNFSDETNQMSDLFKAIGHPARFEILKLILSKKTCLGTELTELIPLSQSTISKHISELKQSNLIDSSNSSNSIVYSINEKVWNKLESFFDSNFLQNPKNLETVMEIEVFKTNVSSKKLDSERISKLKKENHHFKHLHTKK